MRQKQCQNELRAADWCCNEKFETAVLSLGVRTSQRAGRCFMETDKNMQMYVKLFDWVIYSIPL